MPATINGTTGFGGNLTGNVTGNVTGTSSAVADGAVSAAKLDGAQTGSAPIYGCRAWVNFNGNAGSTVDGEFRCTIRSSGNVSKVVRTGGATGTDAGVYLVTLTTAMSDSNYSAVCSIKAGDDSARHMDFVSVRPESASVIRIVCSAPVSPFSGVNAAIVSLAIFR